jgi:hypothetical protein
VEENADPNESSAGSTKEFKSRLSTARTKFLAHAVNDSLVSGRRTSADFIKRFPPVRIMEALSDKPELRARLLVETTGTRHNIAVQKSPGSAGEDLQIALDVGETNVDDIVRLFRPDDRVRYLDAKELWEFVCEGEFWKQKLDGMALEISRSHIGYLIDKAMEEKLLKARDVIDGIGVSRLAEVLPRAELGWMLEKALERGRGRKPFTDEQFLAEAPVGVLADRVPLSELWENVIAAHVAVPQGFADRPTKQSAPPPPLRGESTVARVPIAAIEESAGRTNGKSQSAADEPDESSDDLKPKSSKADASLGAAPFDFSDVTASEEIEEAVAQAAVKASKGE